MAGDLWTSLLFGCFFVVFFCVRPRASCCNCEGGFDLELIIARWLMRNPSQLIKKIEEVDKKKLKRLVKHGHHHAKMKSVCPNRNGLKLCFVIKLSVVAGSFKNRSIG